MAVTRLLIVDPDEAECRSLAQALGARGYEVVTALNVEEGLARTTSALPHAIILDASLPKIRLSSLVQKIRARAERVLIPLIFLGLRENLEDQIRGFKLASDDVLTRPVSPDDVHRRIAQALKVRETTEEAVAPLRPKEASPQEFTIPGPLSTFRGELQTLGLATLLSLLEAERKTGQLVLITEGRPEKARLYILGGRVIRAELDGKSEPRNAELIYELLRESRGKFDLRAGLVNPLDEINLATHQLLIEGARRLDETGTWRSQMG